MDHRDHDIKQQLAELKEIGATVDDPSLLEKAMALEDEYAKIQARKAALERELKDCDPSDLTKLQKITHDIDKCDKDMK